MADDVIGRADYELRARLDQLRKDLADAKGEVAKSGSDAEQVFTTRSARWAPAIAGGLRVGLKAVGAATAGMLAIATSGAIKLQDVQNEFQSETGASAEEAKRAAGVINRAAGENQASLESVSAAAIAVHNDLGAVGDQADDLLNRFTKFARVTKQEPVAAVKAFDDIMDAWKLTAADVPGLMDKLVASHQKYGGAVTDDQAALAQLAPAMKAVNLNVDDAIGLLDLFKASGVDSAAAIGGMTKALSKVKSPEELQRLIDDISATEDPFLRAQKAADLFGVKAGPKLASALAGHSLQDFKIDLNEVKGATDKAADALDQGFGPQARKKLSEWGAALRGLGADWGPLLTGASSVATVLGTLGFDRLAETLGPKLATALKAVGKQGGEALVDAVGAATGAAGTIIGNVIADPIAAAFDPDRNSALGRAYRAGGAKAGAIYSAAVTGSQAVLDAGRGIWRRIAGSRVGLAAATAAGTVGGAVYGAAAVVGTKLAELFAPIWAVLSVKLRGPILAAGLASGIMFGTSAAEGASGAQAIAGIASAGTKAGIAFSLAASAAIVALPVAVTYVLVQQNNQQRQQQQDQISADVEKVIADGSIEGMHAALDRMRQQLAIEQNLDSGVSGFVRGLFGGKGATDQVQHDIDALTAAIDAQMPGLTGDLGRHGQAAIKAFGEGASRATPDVARRIPDGFQRAMNWQALIKQSKAAGNRAAEALAQGILAARQKPVDAFQTLKEMLKHPLTQMAEQSRLLGELTSRALMRGLKSHDPAIRDQARATKQYIIDRLEELKTGAGTLSKQQAALVARGLRSHDPEIRAAAREIRDYKLNRLKEMATHADHLSKEEARLLLAGLKSKNAQIRAAAEHVKELAEKPIRDLRDKARAYGTSTGQAYGDGLASTVGYIRRAAKEALAGAGHIMRAASPPGPESPLHLIDVWGERTMRAWADGALRSRGYIKLVAKAVSAAAAPPGLSAALVGNGMATRAVLATAGPVFAGTQVPRGTIEHHGVTINGLHITLNGIGSDVSPAAARRFGQSVLDEVAQGVRRQRARSVLRAGSS